MLNVEKCICHYNSIGRSKMVEKIGGGIEESIVRIQGSFVLAAEQEDRVILGCDIIRSIPLFYCVKENTVWIGDDAAKIAGKTRAVLHEDNIREFLRASYVTENETVYQGICQVLPGEFVVISKEDGSIFRKFYYECRYTCDDTRTENQALEALNQCLEDVFRDMIMRLEGRTALIPLSGGCDSRTAAAVLKRLGYKEVICFSYGRAGNNESVCSKRVAQALGYPWHFIEYNEKVWKNFYRSSDYNKYMRFSCRGNSIGSLQPLPAVLEIRKRRLAPDTAVVIPGHALDFLAGSHIHIEDRAYSRKEIVEILLRDHYSLRKSPRVHAAIEKWAKNLPETLSKGEMIREYMLWEWKNRQAKFIANDVRAYEYAGFEWELPFWDKRVCDFFTKMPHLFLEGRYLQYRYTQKYVDPIAGIRMNYTKHNTAGKEKLRVMLKKIYLLRYLNHLRNCLRNYKHTSNAFYDHMSGGEYLKCMWRYGLDFNLNTIEAEDYIELIYSEENKKWGEV